MQPRPSRWVCLAWVSSQRRDASRFQENNNSRIPACAKSVSQHRLQEIVATACRQLFQRVPLATLHVAPATLLLTWL